MRNRFVLEKIGAGKLRVEAKKAEKREVRVRVAESREPLEGPIQTWKFFPFDMDGDAARQVKSGRLKDQPLVDLGIEEELGGENDDETSE